MNLEEMKARLAAITSELEVFENVENFTGEDVESIETLSAEFEAVTKTIEAKERIANIKAISTVSTKKTVSKPVARVEVTATRKEKLGGFTNLGEFAMAVKSSATGSVDKRFTNNAMFERNGSEGGFLIPEDFMSEIQKKINSDESLISKTRQFSVSGNSLTMPIDETQPWNGGVQAYWTAEGQPITESGLKFSQASLKLNKLAAMVRTTDELLDDATALESYIRRSAPEAIIHQLNTAIISGNGVGKPEGILNSSFKVIVAKESGQIAGTIVARNVIKMYNRMLPQSRAKAVWYVHPECEDQLRTLKDDNGNFIYLAAGSQMNNSPYGLLLGRPVVSLLGSGMKQLGSEGDLILCDLEYVMSISKGGVQAASSIHLHFDSAQHSFRFIHRVDARCPYTAPVQVENGSYEMSGIVTLADRA